MMDCFLLRWLTKTDPAVTLEKPFGSTGRSLPLWGVSRWFCSGSVVLLASSRAVVGFSKGPSGGSGSGMCELPYFSSLEVDHKTAIREAIEPKQANSLPGAGPDLLNIPTCPLFTVTMLNSSS